MERDRDYPVSVQRRPTVLCIPWSIDGLMLAPPITARKEWADTVNSKFLPLEFLIRQQDGFSAQIDMLDRTWQLAIVRTQAHRVARTRHLAERAERGFFKVFWLLHGSCEIEQGSNRASLRPGDWALYDTTRPYAIEFSNDTQFLVFLLPHESCTGWGAVSDRICGRALPIDPSSHGALFALLSMFDAPVRLPTASIAPVIDAAGRMLSASVLAWIDLHRDANVRVRLPLAQRYVLDHIGDDDLTPERLANALNVSRRTLYQGFHDLGLTPASFILETRLERCSAALLDPGQRHQTITRIALDHGFCDGAHFSRLFKARYGMTPRQWRENM
jgi:AraC-like DNA-binding protein